MEAEFELRTQKIFDKSLFTKKFTCVINNTFGIDGTKVTIRKFQILVYTPSVSLNTKWVHWREGGGWFELFRKFEPL